MTIDQLTTHPARSAVLLAFLADSFDSPKEALEAIDEVRNILTMAIEEATKELLEDVLAGDATLTNTLIEAADVRG
jgi:hypothetical protein